MRFILRLKQIRSVFFFFMKSEGTRTCILLCFSDFISYGPLSYGFITLLTWLYIL